MRKLALIYIAVTGLALAGCESLSAILKNPDQLESIYKAAAAGDYKVEVSKNGQVLHTERWVCEAGEKLQCKRAI
jgi:uncharacterized protein YcfL